MRTMPVSEFISHHRKLLRDAEKGIKNNYEFIVWLDDKGNSIPVAKNVKPMIQVVG